MRRCSFLLLVALLVLPQSAGLAQESLTLTTPVSPLMPTTTTYSIRGLILLWDEQFIAVRLRDNNGVTSNYYYTGAQAGTLMVALNKADLSAISLQRRILQQLVKDGKLPAGNVTGSPE